MLPSADVIRADFDRIAACSRPQRDGLEPAARRLVAEVPLRSRVLEIGCGTGALARELATKRGARVTAIDLSPRMIDVARVRTPRTLGIDYHVADFAELSPRGFDIIVAVNTLHHLPLESTAARMAAGVAPGGKVLVADLFTARGVLAWPYNGLSWLLRPSSGESQALRDAWDAHWEHDDIPTLREVRRALGAILPGVSIRRHLGWRYSAIWQRPHA